MGVYIDIISFTKNELLLKIEDGVILKITGNHLKYSSLTPDESYENYYEYKEKYIKNNSNTEIRIIEIEE